MWFYTNTWIVLLIKLSVAALLTLLNYIANYSIKNVCQINILILLLGCHMEIQDHMLEISKWRCYQSDRLENRNSAITSNFIKIKPPKIYEKSFFFYLKRTFWLLKNWKHIKFFSFFPMVLLLQEDIENGIRHKKFRGDGSLTKRKYLSMIGNLKRDWLLIPSC